MSSAFRVLILAVLVLSGAAPAASAASSADDWSLAPSGGGRPSFYAEGAPGAVLQDTVSVINRRGQPVTVRLRGTGVAVAFADGSVRVPARTRADVPFTVSVPTGAAPGDLAGSIVADDGDGRSRTVALRLRAVGPKLSALTVEHVAVGADGISYELVNRGTTALVPTLAVRADGVFGRRVLDRAPRTLPVELAPGRRIELTEPWPDRPALDSVDVRLTVTAAGGARDEAGASVWCVPWGAVAGGLAAGVAGAAPAVVRRWRRRTAEDGDVSESPRTEVELTGAVT
ncbi:hypothetical protein QQY66_19145 [Streptomyces sp. DG2A-72]|uniref:COG1470 family protein n=1 Tax=Streptomyces sp. DG2A-72 TaxID=3051386 RepID=UPI00265C4151|nr:hypothetical protein [Streptomyces sp. DG2A-72]MDO0933697.1 hypothetical protein [Streptomyces sp. DG2A-72]